MLNALYDIIGCHNETPVDQLLDAMRESARTLGCRPLSHLIETFQPHGATCVLILAESHMTVSTWPEHDTAHLDVFTCRADIPIDTAIVPILAALGGHIAVTTHIPRLDPRAAPSASPEAPQPSKLH